MSNQYIPNTEEEYMNPSQLQYFKTKLLAMKEEYENTFVIKLKEINNEKYDLNDETYSDSYMDVDLASEDNNSHMLKEIGDALARINKKSYGYCEDTMQKIGIKRLLANPVARYCIQTQEKREQNNMYNT